MRTSRIFLYSLVFAACGGESVDPVKEGGSTDSPITNPDVIQPGDGSPIDDGSVTDAGIDTNPPGFDPKTVPGLALWLDANKDVVFGDGGANVTDWKDQSGNNNHAAQATVSQQPTQVTGAVNGLPVVHFAAVFPYYDGGVQNGVGQMMTIADSATLQFGTADFSIYVVSRYTNPTAGYFSQHGTWYSKNINGTYDCELWANYPAGGGGNTAGFAVNFGGGANPWTAAGAYNDNKARLFVGRRNGTQVELRLNGTVQTLNTITTLMDVSAGGQPVHIGATPSGTTVTGNRLQGDIAEIIAVKGTITATDLANLEGYFQTKYALW